jgi:kynurenine formamidase
MPTVDQLSLERLIAPGVLIDVRSQTEQDPNYLISVQDLLNWERANGQIPNGVILLFRTGWGRYYPHKKEYLGTDEKGSEAISKLRFPGLDPAAARWLVMNRSVAAVGIDTASIDYGKSELFESHQILFKKGIPAFENVANLDRLPDAGFQIIALPMKIAGGSGGPLRIVAILDD